MLSHSFDSVRKHPHFFNEREKDHYDQGAIKKIFTHGDLVRVRLKSMAEGLSKFQSEWSIFYKVVTVNEVVVTFGKLSSNRKYIVHHDRLLNLLLMADLSSLRR